MLIATTPMVLVSTKNLPVEALKDVVGSAGIGSGSHLTLLLLANLTKGDFQHVPYRGLSQAVNELIAGQIDVMFDQVISASPHILAGTVKPIAVTAANRANALPKVPTSIEAGVPDLQAIIWTALFAPKGTPKPIVERITVAVDQAMNDPAASKRLTELGADLPPPGEARAPQALGTLVGAVGE